jgi:hypothetical protein
MRRLKLLIAGACLSIPAECCGLGFCVYGNDPQPAGNYEAWPGLLDVVNDASRQALCWVNGNEHLWYSGDTAALNRVLKEFAEVEAEELHVVLLPGPGQTKTIDGKEVNFDWRLHVVGGIVRRHVDSEGLTRVWDVHPTLAVLVTERLDLGALAMPEGVKVLQWDDLRQRYVDAQVDGNDRTKEEAGRLLQELEKDAHREGEEADEYRDRIAQIRKYVAGLQSKE